MREAQHLQFFGENRHSWKDAVTQWTVNAGVKPSVVKRYLSSINQLRTILDALFVDEIDRKTLNKIAHRTNVTNATRRRDLTAVSTVLQWCVRHDWIEANPAKALDRSGIRERRDPITLPSDADIERIVRLAPGNFSMLIRFAQFTGMRQEECASLEWLQVSEARKAATLTKTKSGRPRVVPLEDRALAELPGTNPGTASAVIPLRWKWVFWHGAGDRYSNIASRFAELTKRADKAAKKAKQPFRRFRFHDLRHWFAVDYLKRGGSIYDLKLILGHASIRTTEIYLEHLTPDERAGTLHGTAATVRGGN